MQDYKVITITREQILPMAAMMRSKGVALAMIHGHIDDDGQPVVSYEFEVGSGIESYRIAGEKELPTLSKIYDAAAEWPEREIMELMDIRFDGLDASKRLFMPESMISGQGHILVTPMDQLIDQAHNKEE